MGDRSPETSRETALVATAGPTVSPWLVGAAGLAVLGALHWTLIVGQSASRGVDESPLAVAGFVALELLLLLLLLPVIRFQARRFASGPGPAGLRIVLHLALALVAVVAYRATVLSAALVVELGAVSPSDLVLWWEHAGPWQLQADLLLYAGLGTWFAVGQGAGRRESGSSADAPRTAMDRSPDADDVSGSGTEKGAEWLTVPRGDSVHVLGVEEVRWIEGAGTYVRVHADDRSYLLRDTLERLATRLGSVGFVRVHRSAVVNLRYLESLRPAGRGRWTARLIDGTSVRVAASRREELEAALGDSIGG